MSDLPILGVAVRVYGYDFHTIHDEARSYMIDQDGRLLILDAGAREIAAYRAWDTVRIVFDESCEPIDLDSKSVGERIRDSILRLDGGR